ncbi:MAG TPA: ABC transporter ATP-binding protein [Dehalococcoidales bacterium]|nr:MAG: ABC transporter ATP-binding protein [Chloroflexi bacterium RBG_16_60_22]HJX13977.1 ABC transporter ATP-binding protein [Dehalococcoidales bacterium]
MPEEPLLKVSDINVFYGGLQALWEISLTVNTGEIVAIIGANGAGKSTLLNTIAGVIHPARGSIEFEGRRINTLEPFHIVSRGVCLVPEAGRTFPNMTVRENLNIGSYNSQARGKKMQNLELVYEHLPVLKERQNQLAKTLSGGERQMLAIGRGLMSDPKLMLFDELSLGLSPIIINELYRVLREIRARGITVILVEQNVRRSLKEADRAYILECGRVVLSGNVAELREEEKVQKAYFGT